VKFLHLAMTASIAIHAEVPYTFKANDPAHATEVNQNFKYLDSAVATKANRAPLELAIESINQKASKSDLDSRLDIGTFTSFQKKMSADSAMLDGKIKATATSAQVKTDLDAIRADVATKASAADVSKLSSTVGSLASATDLAKLKDAIGAKADTTAMKTAQGDIAALKTSVGTLAKAADLTKTQSELASLTKTVETKADTTALKVVKGSLSSLDAAAVKHVTIDGTSTDFNTPPYGSSFMTINSALNTPFGSTSANWYNLLSLRHRNGTGDGDVYGGQIAWGMTGFQGRLAFRSQAGKWSPWVEVLTKTSITAADLPGGPYVKESPSLSVDSSGVVHMAALKVHSDIRTPDYVFEPDYKLSTLAEVESFTRENKHLPDVPSAAEIEKGGLDLAKMNLALLKKVEELTLHAIAQEKRIEALETEIRTLR